VGCIPGEKKIGEVIRESSTEEMQWGKEAECSRRCKSLSMRGGGGGVKSGLGFEGNKFGKGD